MNTPAKERLYNQLPAVYRIRDKKEGEPLRALLAVIETELGAIEKDIDGLYNNWFIETCEDWVVPYIGDLLGVQNLHNIGSGVSQRAYVANTLGYRRRKGTPAVIEQLAWDVTGWHARVVEFFKLLATLQNMNHIRSDCTTIDLHNADGLELLGSPFESAAHTIDVRRIEKNGGRYNIPNIGIFLWRLKSYFIKRSTARKVNSTSDGNYILFTFSPPGNDTPLFNQPQTEKDITHLAEEMNVPGLLRRRALSEDLKKYRESIKTSEAKPDSVYFGDKPVFSVFADGLELRPEFLMICDLGNWGLEWKPPEIKEFQNFKRYDNTEYEMQVAVDPVLGRLVFLTMPQPARVEVSYSYGFSGDIGGGPYGRELDRELLVAGRDKNIWKKNVSQQDGKTLGDALADWAKSRVYLFTWDEIPGNDNEKLIEFLKQKFGIYWVATAKIENDGKTIKVSTEKNSLTLKLNDEETKVDLQIDDGRTDEFIVKTEDDKLNIYSKANAVITITDNSTYEVKDITLELQDDERLVIQANNGKRPMLRFINEAKNVTNLNMSGGNGLKAQLVLNGLLIEGGIYIDKNSLGLLKVEHCTFVPGIDFDNRQPSVNVAEGNGSLKVEIDHSITGFLCLPSEIESLRVLDSIIDTFQRRQYAIADEVGGAGPPATIERSTVFGKVYVKELTRTSNVIFNNEVTVERQQHDCVRYSFIPDGSRTPRRYRCQPDLEIAKEIEDEEKAENMTPDKSKLESIRKKVHSWLVPAYSSRNYGNPGYGQLHINCPEQIRTGAEDGSEMGAFHHLMQPQRKANLRAVLDEYLRFGLKAEIFYVDEDKDVYKNKKVYEDKKEEL